MSSSSSSIRATAIASFLVGASCTVGVSWFLARRRRLKEDAQVEKNGSSSTSSSKALMKKLPQELREEQLSRHTLYFGADGMDLIRGSKVCVVGLGGVGSHTAVMLARGGVECLRLIDFDQVTLSSLNRHACATLDDVGIPKVNCVQAFCQRLSVPNVDAQAVMYTEESGPKLLDGHDWDFVIDCIDDVPTKAVLLAQCWVRNIRVLSCMGAGGKSDMTRLTISDLRTASKDPLASKLRQTLKRVLKRYQPQKENSSEGLATDVNAYLDDMDQLTIIYSSEKTVCKLADLTEEQKKEGDKQQFGAVDGMRIRVLPVLGPIPAIMGQSLASIALCELGKKPIQQPITGERVGRNVRNRMFQHLKRREDQIANGKRLVADAERVNGSVWNGPLQVDHDDMEYMLGVWRNRCAATGAKLGTVLEFVRWDLTKPSTPENLVLLCAHALEKYDKEGKCSIPQNVQERIEKRLSLCRDQNCDMF